MSTCYKHVKHMIKFHKLRLLFSINEHYLDVIGISSPNFIVHCIVFSYLCSMSTMIKIKNNVVKNNSYLVFL